MIVQKTEKGTLIYCFRFVEDGTVFLNGDRRGFYFPKYNNIIIEDL